MTVTEQPQTLPGSTRQSTTLGLPAIAALAALAYMVMIGGTGYGELVPLLHLVNGLVAGALILAYVMGLRRADRADTAVLAAFVLFTGAALLSTFPRQSLDAVLAALAYAAGLFVARDLLSREIGRRMFRHVLITLSLLVTVVAAARWLPLILEWWSLTDWEVAPPVGFELPGGGWGHRHDLALLVAMLYPSWWIGHPSMLRRVSAVLVGALALVIVLVDGSRMLWLALTIATVVVAGPIVVRRWPRRRRSSWLLLGLVLAGLTVVAVSGVAATIADRLASFASLEYRFAMWGPLTEAWLAHPISGLGPGSFAWILQTTAYFDTNTWAPRHPDSLLFQLLPEAGVLGLSAILILGAALIPAIMRGRSVGARWALIAFAAAGIGANPTDFAFLVVVAIAWTAYAVPHVPIRRSRAVQPSRRWPRFAAVAALGVIGVAYLSAIAASFSYADAGTAVRSGDLPEGEARLTTAIALDPGTALYWRQRGTARLLRNATSEAVGDLQRAVTLNPTDDLAWRTLALARSQEGDVDSAIAASNRALTVQRADPSNLLLAARLALDAGRSRDALVLLAEVVQAWPESVAAPGWEPLVADGDFTTADVISEAAARADHELPAPRTDHPLLAVLTGRSGTESLEADALARARLASYRCESGVREMLAAASDAQRRQSGYWELVIRESLRQGAVDDRAVRLFEIMTGTTLDPTLKPGTLNPLYQHDSPVMFGSDIWGYRRVPLAWPQYEVQLPSPGAGALRWLFDPIGAGRSAGLPQCLAGEASGGD